MGSFQKRFGWLFLLSSAGFLLSFGNQLVVSFHFGTSVELDAYWALFATINLLLFYVQPVREALVPPVFTASSVDRDHASALFSAGLAAQSVLAFSSMALLVMAPVGMLAHFGVDESNLGRLVFGFLPFFVLYALAETCNGLLLSFNRVVYQAAARLLAALIGLTCLWLLAGRIGLLALVLSLLTTQIVTLLASIIGLRRERVRWTWQGFAPLWKEPRFRSVVSALLVTYLLAQVYVVVERVTMLNMQPGLVASYQYSVTLVNVLISLMALPLANLLWPHFLAQASHEGSDVMLQTAARVVAPLTLILLACCSFTKEFSVEIVQLLFARGSFDAASVHQTSQALRATVFAALSISLFTIFSKILFAQGRGRAIAAGGVSIAVSGLGVVLLAGWLGSVTLVQWHWAIGNTVGLCVILYLLLLRVAQPGRYVRAALAFLFRASSSVFPALWATSLVANSGDAWGPLAKLVLALIVFGGSVALLAGLTGALDLRQMRRRRS
jgi:putative peptidoglycan lipid II flippase